MKPHETYHIIGHRDREVLLGRRGEQISVAAINFHDGTFHAVNGYQFVQSEPGRCILYIVPAVDRLSEKECQQIAGSVASKLSPAVVCEVRQCRELALTQRGKYKMVIQNCELPSEIPLGGVRHNLINWVAVCCFAHEWEVAA